eukprot:4983408-Ditylum_brightwellii.AAC.1
MDNHCLAPKGNGLDCAFSNAVLVVCPNTTEGKALRVQSTIRLKSSRLEDAIVCVIVFDADVKLGGKALKCLFCIESVGASMICKGSAAAKFRRLGFFAKGIREAAMMLRFILVSRNLVTRSDIAYLQNSL